MTNSKLLTLVLSSDQQPFRDIRLKGQTSTWIARARESGFQVIPYVTEGDSGSSTSRAIGVMHAIEEAVNHTPAHQFRIIRGRPGRLSSKVNDLMNQSSLRLGTNQTLHDTLVDGLPFIGARTLRAFDYALANYDFQYLARTNTSSYLDVKGLSEMLPSKSSQGFVYGLTGSWGRDRYPSGALYVMSRSDIEVIVANRNLWIHEYIDDVALGLFANKVLGGRSFVPIPRFDFPFSQDISFAKPPSGFVHYRCKSPVATTAIARMRAVHSEVVGAESTS